jgi:hypothetical protein
MMATRTVPKDARAEWPPTEPPNLSARSVSYEGHGAG